MLVVTLQYLVAIIFAYNALYVRQRSMLNWNNSVHCFSSHLLSGTGYRYSIGTCTVVRYVPSIQRVFCAGFIGNGGNLNALRMQFSIRSASNFQLQGLRFELHPLLTSKRIYNPETMSSSLHPKLVICQNTKAHSILFTKMRDEKTSSESFVRYSKRSMRLLAEGERFLTWCQLCPML